LFLRSIGVQSPIYMTSHSTRPHLNYLFFFHYGATALLGHGLPIVEDSWSQSDTPHSVGIPWTSDQPDA